MKTFREWLSEKELNEAKSSGRPGDALTQKVSAVLRVVIEEVGFDKELSMPISKNKNVNIKITKIKEGSMYDSVEMKITADNVTEGHMYETKSAVDDNKFGFTTKSWATGHYTNILKIYKFMKTQSN